MKSLAINAPAGDELGAAVTWYEAKRRGLGGEFYDAVARAIDLIRTHPEIGMLHAGRFAHRRFPLTRFPYTIVTASAKPTSISWRSRITAVDPITGRIDADQAG